MKLKELTIDGFGARHDLYLGCFGDGLTIVYGENGAGKTTVREFVRGTLFDIDKRETLPTSPLYSAGRLNVTYGPDEFQLSRDVQVNSAVDVRPLTNLAGTTWIDRVNSLSRLTGSLNSELYDSVFSVSFRETPNNAKRLANVLRTQLEVPCGPETAGDESAHSNWQRESQTRRQQAESLRARMDALTVEKDGNLNQIDSARVGWQGRIDDIERQISQVLARLNEVQSSTPVDQLQKLENEIAQLRLLIDAKRNQVAYVAPEVTDIGHHATHYQRLDDIDYQIRRWRDVQSDIQNRRLRLRDEMLVWNELTLDSDEHPYHNARAMLVSLESKVDEAERNANHWGDAASSRVDTSQMALTLGQLCQAMRDDLYGICNELAHQYKHIRHKAAAAELKQLRRCYSEMGENIQQLIQRRELVIREIRGFDAAGADAIIRADIKFCECAQHEGYLEARKRFVGNFSQPAVHASAPDLTAEQSRLAMLEQQRRDMITTQNHFEREQGDLSARHAELVRQRDALRNEPNCHELNVKLQNIDGQLHLLTSEHAVLLRQIEKDRNYVSIQPNPLILSAGGLLNRMSNGDLTQVFLIEKLTQSVREPQIELQVRDRYGKVLNFSAIDSSLQNQVYLSLMLSAKAQLQQQGVMTPTLIDDAFDQLSSERVTPVLQVLSEFANKGHQIVALTQHRYLADRIPGVPLLELPPTMPASQPFSNPDRRSATPPVVAPIPDIDWKPESFAPTPSVSTSALPRPYPLSKYSHSTTNGTSDFDDMIAVPFPVSGQQSTPIQMGPRLHANHEPRQTVASVSVNSFGDRLGYAAGVDETTRLDKLGFFDANQLRILQSHGIDSVADMLDLQLGQGNTLGLSPEQVNRWQSQLWLLINLPGIRINDARVLVACGVTDPEQLDTSHPQQILDRIERFFATTEGRRFAGDRDSISLDRVNGWYRSLDATRSRWGNRRRQGSRGFEQAPRTYQPNERESRSQRELSDNDRRRSERSTHASRPAREPRLARPPRMNTPRPERKIVPRVAPVSNLSAEKFQPKEKAPVVVGRKLKFYLDLKDHIEAAPSIGPKTAERFEKIEVVTVADFLKQTAESMATKIKYKRMNADLIRDWQHQARLVCRVPNLRGHDAQLLVACGITEPEELSTMQPKSLFEIIGPFSETKEGLKIIRNGKKPDLAEITDWISWAEQTRSLQAA